ncbi:hypothetical protein EW146_g4974 [Bondarzewia mesenterica]|uniref:Clathrin/coatomer adaptor adaptin-like N-terminal domain-containing protein n=1 Tax=Bondarzewia mesenterica TaxID=1095465 RepID=A0A4S4LSW0_9AGAM|nr:hypothetical protein EW146_g4974 [Bondarzewia mesenterica]
MEIPFISSGALSRTHYALVRNVEGAATAQEADKYLMAEVDSLRDRLSRPGLSSKQCRECLILLLYCSMAVSSGMLVNAMEFALPHAVNLAEVGTSIHERRIGYLFCAEMMPSNHELHLMLVNTDLESIKTSRMCLALDYIIQSPWEDVIPAVQSRLHDLLSHNSPHVRRRVLLCIRALAVHDPSMLQWMSREISKRLRDTDDVVVSAAITACSLLYENNLLGENTMKEIMKIFKRSSQSVATSPTARQITQRTLHLISFMVPSQEAAMVTLELLQRLAGNHIQSHALLYECFLLLQHTPLDILTSLINTPASSPIVQMRHLITSEDPNEQYLFLSCLECVDPVLWAGTMPNWPAVLDGWEVERVMQFLESPDAAIRRKTLRILSSVDQTIVSSYFSQVSNTLSSVHRDEGVARLLEIGDVMSGLDGELYAHHVKDIFNKFGDDSGDQGGRRVLEHAVEQVLTHIRDGEVSFGLSAATTLLTLVTDADEQYGSSLMLIVSALACEYAGRVSVSPVQLLLGIQKKLRQYSASIQEACLLAMLRLAAECDKIPPEVVEDVKVLNQMSGRHIQRRCAQFIALCSQPVVLKRIASSARSHSLPDFLLSLESHQHEQPSNPSPSVHVSPPSPPSTSPRASSSSKLRYAAYDAPPPSSSRARIRRSSSTQTVSSTRSTISDDLRPESALSGRDDGTGVGRTVTPGQLALMAGSEELRNASRVRISTISPKQPTPVDLMGSRIDLISLDSPFISDPTVSLDHALAQPGFRTSTAEDEPERPEHDFEGSWNALKKYEARGWCEVPTDSVIRRLQGLQYRMVVLSADQPPFEGELKVLLSYPLEDTKFGRGSAALRLRESDEDGCLWRLRCDDEKLFTDVKRTLSD